MLADNSSESFSHSKFPLWLRRSFLYGCLYAFIGLLLYFVKSKFGFLKIDPDSARYMLSALVQSEAAILAIVVTLSLVAVQQTAASYSPRVIKVFKDRKRNPDFYILIISYVFAMVYGVWVLTQVSDNEGCLKNFTKVIFFESFSSHMWLSYSFGIFAFTALIIYIGNTLDLLDPSKIIDVISESIADVCVDSRPTNKDNNTPIEQIFDIVNSSLVRKDCRTAKYGLETIKKRVDQIDKNKRSSYTSRNYSRLISYFAETGINAVILGDRDTTSDVIKCIKDIAINEPDVTNKGVLALREIGVKAAEQRMNDATNEVASSLKDIGLNEIKKWKQETSSKIE